MLNTIYNSIFLLITIIIIVQVINFRRKNPKIVDKILISPISTIIIIALIVILIFFLIFLMESSIR